MNKPTKPVSIDDIKALIRDLPPAEKVQFFRDGENLAAEAIAVNQKVVYGYRCKRCNEVGLEFLGDLFIDPSNGLETDRVPLNIPIENLPWKSEPRENRRTPKCRKCGAMLTTESDGCLTLKRVVNIKAYNEDRHKAMEQFNQSVGVRFRGNRSNPYLDSLSDKGVHSMSVPTKDGKVANLTEPANTPTSMKTLEGAMADKGIKL